MYNQHDKSVAMVVLEQVSNGETTMDMQTAHILLEHIQEAVNDICSLKDKLRRRNKQIKDLKVKLSMAITQMEGCSAWLKSSNQPQVAKGTDEIIKKLECPFCYGEGEAKEFKEV